MNRSSDIYPRPDTFDPTRAEQIARANGTAVCPFSKAAPHTYVPFGAADRRTGHRCLAEELVYLVLGSLVAQTVHSHTWTAVEPEKLRAVPAPHMADAVTIEFRRGS